MLLKILNRFFFRYDSLTTPEGLALLDYVIRKFRADQFKNKYIYIYITQF